MVDSTRGHDELLGYVYFGKLVPPLLFFSLFTLSFGDGDGRSSNCGDVETVAFSIFYFLSFAMGASMKVDCIFFYYFYDLLVSQFQIIPYYPSEFNLLDLFSPVVSRPSL